MAQARGHSIGDGIGRTETSHVGTLRGASPATLTGCISDAMRPCFLLFEFLSLCPLNDMQAFTNYGAGQIRPRSLTLPDDTPPRAA